jgi:TolB-like protein/Flp pilus assembly protein TadD
MPGILGRLRDRKLTAWSIAYLAAAWVLLQVIGFLAQSFDWPVTIVRVSTILLGAGFLAAVVVAWFHGERGHQRVTGVELALLALIALLAGGSVLAFGIDRTLPQTEPADGTADLASIAVLPFADLSTNKDQAYFSDGLAEELLNVLSRVPNLRVAARTSSFSFRNKEVPVDSIGRALRVAYILEGSVRSEGNSVRITVQLIDAKNGFHVWSQNYDRELKEIFVLQDEVGRAVAERLRLSLSDDTMASPPAKRSVDPIAYRLGLRAQALAGQGTPAAINTARALLDSALALDSTYARAYGGLASLRGIAAYNRWVPREEGYAQARILARRALALDRSETVSHNVLGWIADRVDWDFATAEQHYRETLRIDPNNAGAMSSLAPVLMRQGRTAEAIQWAERAVENDPVSSAALNSLALIYAYAERQQDMIRTGELALQLTPNNPSYLINLARFKTQIGQFDEAIDLANRALALDPRSATQGSLASILARAGRRDEARALLEKLERDPRSSAFMLAGIHRSLGNQESALNYLEQALRERDDRGQGVGIDPNWKAYRTNPRFQQLLNKHGLPIPRNQSN